MAESPEGVQMDTISQETDGPVTFGTGFPAARILKVSAGLKVWDLTVNTKARDNNGLGHTGSYRLQPGQTLTLYARIIEATATSIGAATDDPAELSWAWQY